MNVNRCVLDGDLAAGISKLTGKVVVGKYFYNPHTYESFIDKEEVEIESVVKTINESGLDFKKILVKYVQYVRDVEGTDFVVEHDNRHASDVDFTETEWAWLTDVCKSETIYKKGEE